MIQAARNVLPELTELDGLLQLASFGIEFQDIATIREAQGLMQKIATSSGLESLGHFLSIMSLLAKADQYQLLSSEHYQAVEKFSSNSPARQV